MRIRKAERERLTPILDSEGDLDEVVSLVFDACADLLLERDWFVLIVNDPPVYYLFGPYESEATAKREVKHLVSTRKAEPLEYVVRKLHQVRERL